MTIEQGRSSGETYPSLPTGITSSVESSVRRALSTGYFWNRKRLPLPQAVLKVMEDEAHTMQAPITRLPSGEINPQFLGYAYLLSDVVSAWRYTDPRMRLAQVESTHRLSSIFEERFGDASLNGYRDPSFSRFQRDLDLIAQDPTGLALAREKTLEFAARYGEDSGEYSGAAAALHRYEELLATAQRLSSS